HRCRAIETTCRTAWEERVRYVPPNAGGRGTERMKAEATDLPDVWIVHSPVYADSRGFFTEVFHENEFDQLGLPTHFAQDSHSRSAKNVLRGLHFQLEKPQGKLIHVVSGVIFDVAVDLRRSSPNYGRWLGVTLESGDGRQLWIPPGFAHGFLALSDTV